MLRNRAHESCLLPLIFVILPFSFMIQTVCFILNADITATAETSFVSFVGFHLTKTHLEGGNYYADVII